MSGSDFLPSPIRVAPPPAPPPTPPRYQAPMAPAPLPRPPIPWRNAATAAESASASQRDGLRASLVLAAPESGQQGGQGSGEGDGQDGNDAASALPGDAADIEQPDVDPRVRYVGETIGMVCRFEQAQCVWSARIPLDPDLLPATVLHLAYSPGLLALRFETTDWDARALLHAHALALERLVAAELPAGFSISVSL
ncbi:type III secretion HpaP family protein [Xylophilus sp. GOD-11R]|uniref:type III secretion HpaP family protein n=1 Tax=Xylophilus sp. GOD-11R TaxID=3089814 RepID=UPI00298C825F|nr:type III secretion HpaP family protein [Xylophilus sp. GOD-11R]WPB57945.1 type III secretion HpaP family protein [Xylophilus sp. GOD-11R]